MKKKLTNNIGIKILSVVLAFIIWIVIVNIDDPVISRTFTVDVDVLNEAVVTSINKVYTVVEGSEVEVTVKGNKSFVDTLKSENILATADLKYLSKTGSVTIDVECNKYTTTKYTLELGDVKNMVVELENITEKRLPIKFNIVGEVLEGYYVSTNQMKARPGTITVTGGESIINKLASIEVDVDVSKKTKDFVVTATPKAYDNNGDVMDAKELKLDFSADTIEVSVSVYRTKTVPINVKITGKPGYGYYLVDTVYEPNSITIAGYPKNLDKISSIDFTFDISDKITSVDDVLELTDKLLPKGVIYTTSDTQIPVEITIGQLDSKEFLINSSDISVKLPAEITTYNFVDPSKQYKVKVLAAPDRIDNVTIDTLKPTIDLTNRTYGTYLVPITFAEGYTVEIQETNQVQVVLTNPNATPNPSITPSTTPGEDHSTPTVTTPTTTPVPSTN